MPWYESQKWGTYSPYAPGTRAVGSGGAQNTVMNVGPLNAGGGYGAYKNKLYSSITSQVAADLGRRGVASSSAYLQSAVRASAEAELAAWQMRQGDRQHHLQMLQFQETRDYQRAQMRQAWDEIVGQLDQYDHWGFIRNRMQNESVGPPNTQEELDNAGGQSAARQTAAATSPWDPVGLRAQHTLAEQEYARKVRAGEVLAPGGSYNGSAWDIWWPGG